MKRVARAAEALGIRRPQNLKAKIAKAATVAVALMGLGLNAGIANAATYSSASVALSDPRPSTTLVNYTFTASTVTTSSVKCIKITFATTATGSTVPTDFDSSVAGVALDTAGTNYVPTPASLTLDKSTNGTLLLTDASGQVPASASGRTISVDGITNSSVADTAYYMHVSTFDNVDCSTSPVDNGTVEFINTNGSTLSLTVDNTLTFTINALTTGDTCSDGTTAPTVNTTATTIPFGTVTSAAQGIACQRLNASTNATNGYSLFVRYDHAPRNALNQTITDWSGSNAAPTDTFAAVDQQGAYGYSTDDDTLGTGTAGRFTTGSKYAANTTSNSEIGYEPTGVTSTDYIVTHRVAVTLTTQPGSYTNTIFYTCTPIY